jgi:hypothetical protein
MTENATNNRYEKEIANYNPTQFELMYLAQYWLTMFFEIDMGFFFDCHYGMSDFNRQDAASYHLDKICKLLDDEAIKEVVLAVDKHMDSKNGGYWDVFKAISPCRYIKWASLPQREGIKSALFYEVNTLPLLEDPRWDIPDSETVLWATLDQLANCNDLLPANACGKRLNGEEDKEGTGITFGEGTTFAEAVAIVRGYCDKLKSLNGYCHHPQIVNADS